MLVRKSALLASVAATALLGASSAAFAFDTVNWDWEKYVDEDVDIDINILIEPLPENVVEVEKLQVHFGDITSDATVSGVYNNQPLDGVDPGTLQVEANVGGNIPYEDQGPTVGVPDTDNTQYISDNPDVVVTALPGGNIDEENNEVDFGFNIVATIDPGEIDGASFDAVTELPHITNAATSVANNQSITSSQGLLLHDAQIAGGAINPDGNPEFLIGGGLLAVEGLIANGESGEIDGVNLHTVLAALATVGAGTGFIDPANIMATATVTDILNASVENAATAVTNNASFTVESANVDNQFVIADLTQWGYANVKATAHVGTDCGTDVDCDGPIELNNYTNLGLGGDFICGDCADAPELAGVMVINRPIVANAATAVGNNLNINVGAPDVDAP